MNEELNVYEEEMNEVEDYESETYNDDFEEEGENSNGGKGKSLLVGIGSGVVLTTLFLCGRKKYKEHKAAKAENKPKTKKKLMWVEEDEDGNVTIPSKQDSE